MSARAKPRWSRVLGGALGLLLVGAYLAGADGSSILVVDRFQETNEANRGGYASGWMIAGNKERDSRIEIVREKATSFLCLVSKKDAFGLKKEMKFDVSKYPFLSWQWRVWENPKGGDIRSRATDDQAGQIYVFFPRFPGVVNTRAIGYIWDPATPRGHSGTSPSFAKMKYMVLQSGEGNLRRWAAESRNVHEDYRRLFQEDPPEAGGILLFINSQFTGTSAECHYREIIFSKTDSLSAAGQKSKVKTKKELMADPIIVLQSRKKIALVAHDNKKKDLLEWAQFNRGLLARHILYATGTTGEMVEKELGLTVHRLQSGPLGGDQQIGAKISEGEIDFLIFFWDPLEPHPHDTDVKVLLRIAVVWNIPVACNRASADFMISSSLMDESYTRKLPDYSVDRHSRSESGERE